MYAGGIAALAMQPATLAHIGFSVDRGASVCTPHRVCAKPTATNGAGEWQSTPARPHHDRECKALDVCHQYQYIEQTETPTSPRKCTACSDSYKATSDFSACYAYKCTHVKCKHVRHHCSRFNLKSSTRARSPTLSGGTTDIAFKNECAANRLFRTIITQHYHEEGTCNEGHWCGMGVISGDAAKCECAPLSLKPAQQDHGQADTPDEKGWSGHSDELTAKHPDDTVPAQGFAAAGTPGSRDRDTAVEYLGTKSAQAGWD